MVTRHLGSLVARGNTSDVHTWAHGSVVKVLRVGIPESWAAREATTTELVHAAGLPAPAVFDLLTVDGRPGIVFERVEGVSMWERMLAHPIDVPELSRLLVELQAGINAATAPSGLPKLRDRLRQNIENAAVLSDVEKTAALADFQLLPDGTALCHFDVHPNNVLMGSKGPVVIDWFDAAAGDPAADIVRSSVLMRPDAAAGHLGGVAPSIVATLHDEYVAGVVEVRDMSDDTLLSWEPTVLASRLAEPVPEDVLLATRYAWNAVHYSREASTLAVALRCARFGS